jgi:hypothetical protein
MIFFLPGSLHKAVYSLNNTSKEKIPTPVYSRLNTLRYILNCKKDVNGLLKRFGCGFK